MGCRLFLEALFATIGTALATGGYIYFIIELNVPRNRQVTDDGLLAGLATVLVFAFVQWLGAGTQAKVTEWMTYGAIVVLVWFWVACCRVCDGSNHDRASPDQGWDRRAPGDPVRYLVVGDDRDRGSGSEEAHEPQRTIPRGLTPGTAHSDRTRRHDWFVAAGAGQ